MENATDIATFFFFFFFCSLPSFKHVFRQFHVLLMISIFEIVAFICYLKSLETLLVAYAIAVSEPIPDLNLI